MTTTIKTLITKNKLAFDSHFYIESVCLSYILINKALKQVVKNDLQNDAIELKIKTSNLIQLVKNELNVNPNLKSKISKKILKDIKHFNKLYKQVFEEIKYQYSEKKIFETAQLGINCIAILNTTLIKIKNNQ